MTKPFNALTLVAINAAGNSSTMAGRNLYSALATNMFFGQKSALEIRVQKDVVQPYFSVELPALASLTLSTKKALLLETCLAQTAEHLAALTSENAAHNENDYINDHTNDNAINSIDELIVVSSQLSPDSEHHQATQQAWEQVVLQSVSAHLPQLTNKLRVVYCQTPSVDHIIPDITQASDFEHPKLLICVDSLVDYNRVKQLNQLIDIQCQEGSVGVMPSEGASSTLLTPQKATPSKATSPKATPTKTGKHSALQMLSVQALNTPQPQMQSISCQVQLEQAQFSLPATVIHVGATNNKWIKHWYAHTQGFYHQGPSEPENALTTYEQTHVLGYLGAANLSTALASAQQLLACPMTTDPTVWIVEHQVGANGPVADCVNVYRVSLTLQSAMQATSKGPHH